MSSQLDECGTRPSFRWVQVQRHSLDMPVGSKNALAPMGIPLKRGADCHWNQDTPDQICVPINAVDQGVSEPSTSQKVVHTLHSAGRDSQCLSLSPTRQDLTQSQMTQRSNYSGGVGEGKVITKLKLEPCWTMLVISSIRAMWAWWA